MRILLLCGLLAVATLAGCFGGDQDPDSDSDGLSDAREAELGTDPFDADSDDDGLPDGMDLAEGEDRLPPHVVVGDIDTGINVYHERFAGTIPDALLATFVDASTGQLPRRIQLAQTGDFETRLEADQARVWDTLERGVLYHFEGTRVLGISFLDDDADENPILDFPDGSHGTATAGSVFDANPEAIVVMVEGVGSGPGELWAMGQPWIDVTTMSYGPVGSPPTSSTEETGTHAATHAGWRGGKLPVGAADNTPSLAPNDATAGPPWVIGVAGDHVETHCRDHVSGTFPDVTANFTQTLPDADSVDARHQTSGTSFATPTTAGTLSAIVLEVRKAWNHTGGIIEGALAVSPAGDRLTNAGVRDAMNSTAYYFETADCEPAPGTSTPVNPVAPWLQMGWGHVGPEVVATTVAVLLGAQAEVGKDSGAVAFQEALYDYRVRLWGEP